MHILCILYNKIICKYNFDEFCQFKFLSPKRILISELRVLYKMKTNNNSKKKSLNSIPFKLVVFSISILFKFIYTNIWQTTHLSEVFLKYSHTIDFLLRGISYTFIIDQYR